MEPQAHRRDTGAEPRQSVDEAASHGAEQDDNDLADGDGVAPGWATVRAA